MRLISAINDRALSILVGIAVVAFVVALAGVSFYYGFIDRESFIARWMSTEQVEEAPEDEMTHFAVVRGTPEISDIPDSLR